MGGFISAGRLVRRVLVALLMFASVYALLAVPRLGRWLREAVERRASARIRPLALAFVGRPGIAATGAALVVLLGEVALPEAWHAIDLRTLALLTGMMLLVGALEAASAFEMLATRLVRWLPTPRALLAGSMAVVALLSALVLNDAVVLLFTPVLIRAARSMRTSPLPFLVGEALAANLGSAATPVGNPQNAAIALARDLDFLEFVRALAPVALLGLALGIAFCLVFFHRMVSAGERRPRQEATRSSNPRMLALALAALALALTLFLGGRVWGIPLWLGALAAGSFALVGAPLAGARPARVLRGVDPGILVLFVGLFVLVRGVREVGLLRVVADSLGDAGSVGFVVATAVLSNVVSNVPAVLLLIPSVQTDSQALLLAVTSTFAGNATFVGSAATLIVAEAARSEGEDFSVLAFTLVGFPLAVVTLALAWWMVG